MKALRPYQVEAVQSVSREWESNRSTLLVLATGCGKTFTAAEIIRQRLEAETGRVLWLAHRDELITQARDAIAAHIPDVRVGIEKASTYANTYSLSEMHDQVVVASVQTLHEKRRTRFDPRLFGTIVVDECHHSTAKSYVSVLNHFPDAKVLGLTATPDRGDGVGLGHIFDTVAFSYDMRTAIEAGYLCPVKLRAVHIEGLDVSKVRTTAGELNQGDLAAVVEDFGTQHAVASVIAEQIGRRQCIVFCVSVKQSKDLAEIIQAYMPRANIRHIDGSTPDIARKRILAEYASGEVQIVTNCSVLTEGFDAPATSMIALVRPTKSRALYTQMVGRGTRLAPNKEDCVVLDFRGNAGRHDLAGPIDLVGTADLDPNVRKVLKEWQDDGKVLDTDAIEAAKAEVADRIRKEEIARKAAAQAAAAIAAAKARAIYTVTPIQAFNACYSTSEAACRDNRAATPGQQGGLVKFGIDEKKAARMTFREASELLDKLTQRARLGKASYKQAKWLAKEGLNHDISRAEASKIMDAASNDRWNVPAWARRQYGVAS